MAFELRNGQGTLWPNDYKTADPKDARKPDYRGDQKLLAGEPAEIAAWWDGAAGASDLDVQIQVDRQTAGRGKLHLNRYKANDPKDARKPDYKGEVEMTTGAIVDIAAWWKGDRAPRFLSVQMQEPRQRAEAPPQQAEAPRRYQGPPQQQRPAQAPPAAQDDDHTVDGGADVPF